MSADISELQRIYAEDYIQSGVSGRLSTRADLIRHLTSGTNRFASMKSTGRRVRLFGDFAVVHGSEEDEIVREGRESCRQVRLYGSCRTTRRALANRRIAVGKNLKSDWRLQLALIQFSFGQWRACEFTLP